MPELQKAGRVTARLIYKLLNRLLRLKRDFVFWKFVEGVPVYVATKQGAKLMEDTEAFAYGETIYARSRRAFTAGVRRHELKHVEQFRKGGWAFVLDYWDQTRRWGYWHNKYERQARYAERLTA